MTATREETAVLGHAMRGPLRNYLRGARQEEYPVVARKWYRAQMRIWAMHWRNQDFSSCLFMAKFYRDASHDMRIWQAYAEIIATEIVGGL